jgi:hypothetical protein
VYLFAEMCVKRPFTLGFAKAELNGANLWMWLFLKRELLLAVATPASSENRFATGGVRADQVGDKLPLRAIAAVERLPAG